MSIYKSSSSVNRIITTGSDAVEYQDTLWEDLRFPFTTLRQGATTKPDFDATNVGLLFPRNDTGEVVYINAQMPHAYKLETALHPHIHFVQSSATTPVFKMDYRWYKNNGDPTVDFTTLTASDFIYSYTSGDILQMVSFPSIDGSGINDVSSMLDIKIYRDDNNAIGDVLTKEFDIHYEIDRVGSRQEFAK